MSFKDCIASAVEAQRVSADRGQTATAAYDEAYERLIAEGMDEGTAAMRAADEAVDSISNLNAARRWQKIKQMQVAHTLIRGS